MSKKEELFGKYNMQPNPTIILPENQILADAQRLREEKEREPINQKLIELDKDKQRSIEEKLKTLELIPNGNKIIVLPYPTNPYKKIMQGSIYLGNNGDFKNPDSGEMDRLEESIICGKVIELGPDCKFGEIGDDVFYDKRTVYPVPFMSSGFVLTSEPQILVWINENLKARFKMI